MKFSNKLQGKVALITGGTSGLGLATAKRFVAEGAQVFVTGRRQDAVDAAVKEIGGTITGVQGDVANWPTLTGSMTSFAKKRAASTSCLPMREGEPSCPWPK